MYGLLERISINIRVRMFPPSYVDVHETILNGKIDISSMSKFLKNVKYDPLIILEKPSENLSMEIEWVQNQKR